MSSEKINADSTQVAAAAPADAAATEEVTVAGDGMRREWNFTFQVKHQAARAVITFNPAWVSQFIDPDDIININKLDRDVKHCPMMPFASYVDQTIAAQTGAFWEECPKSVRLLYSHVPHQMQLESYCRRSVQHILADPRVISVDGQTTLHRLTIGKKMHLAPRLGGRQSFHFTYILADKIRARSEYVYCLGTIVGQRGYLVTVTCSKEQELYSYIKHYFLPQYRDVSKVVLDADVVYEDVTNNVLKEQQELYGELHFHDRDAAVSFAIPMHPARLKPDFSPIQSVGVGSVACMTLELDVNQKLMDDFAEADITGMPKYKVNHVLLFLDVEDVARMGYPGLMSVEQYSNAKMKRLIEVFKDAKQVGAPISLAMGGRCGRSATVTFTYESFGSVVKAMLVSTLVGNFGFSTLYFTKLGGGLFDAHLYLCQQLLKSITFRSAREHSECFSRFQAVQIRLTDQDISRCYSNAPVSEKKTLERHVKSLHQSTDGRSEGRIMVVDPTKGGVSRGAAGAAGGAEPSPVVGTTSATVAPVSGVLSQAGPSTIDGFYNDIVEAESNKTAATQEDTHLEAAEISVSSIPHLASLVGESWEEGSPVGASPPAPPPRGVTAATTTDGAEDDSSAKTLRMDDENEGTIRDATLESTLLRGTVSVIEDGTLRGASMRQENTSNASAAAVTAATVPTKDLNSSGQGSPSSREQQAVVQAVLKEEEEMYFGPSLHDVYMRCCELQRCRPNSYLLKKLPSSPRFTVSIEELDLTSNYLGHNGFVAVLQLLEHLPRLHSVFFNDMSLDNTDVEHMCEVLSTNSSIRSIQLRNNPKITLPATKHLTKLLRTNPRISSLGLQGTKIGNGLILNLEEEASKKRS